MRLSSQKRNVKNESLSGIFDTISIIAVSHMLSNKKDPTRILLRAGFAFTLLCLAFKVEGVAFLFHCNKALKRLALGVVQECLDGQAGIFVIQPFRAHTDNEVVQLSDNIGHQVLVTQGLTNHFIVVFDGEADGSGKTIKFVIVFGTDYVSKCWCYWLRDFLYLSQDLTQIKTYERVKSYTNQDLNTPQKQHKSRILLHQFLPPCTPHTRQNASSMLLQFIDLNP